MDFSFFRFIQRHLSYTYKLKLMYFTFIFTEMDKCFAWGNCDKLADQRINFNFRVWNGKLTD